MWWLYVAGDYLLQMLMLTAAGVGISCAAFSRSLEWNQRLLWAPVLGFCSIVLSTSWFMLRWLPGHQAGQAGVAVSLLLSLTLYLRFGQAKARWRAKIVWQPVVPALLAGLVFLSPLLLTNNHGFFALNGGDFGSYGGWADYFEDKQLVGGRREAPLNFGITGFETRQERIATPDHGERLGNITYFSAIKALSPVDFFTAYECTVAAQITLLLLAVYLLCRQSLRLRHQISLSITWTFVVCNTVAWLASAHFVPNVMAIYLTMSLIASLSAIFRQELKHKLIVPSLIISAIILMYPEMSPIAVIMLGGITVGTFWRQPKKILRCLWVSCVASACGAAISIPFVMYALNWFRLLMTMSMKGDNVGIYEWAYPSQYLGLVDYDFVLKGESFRHAPAVTLTATALACALLALRLPQARQKGPLLGLLGALVVFTIQIVHYFVDGSFFFGFRGCVIASAFAYLLIMALSVESLFWRTRTFPPKVKLSAPIIVKAISAVCLIALLGLLCNVRLNMIRRIIKGTPHACIFGNDYMNVKQLVSDAARSNGLDYLFINYHGTGTIQAAWEWLFLRFPYVLPINGEGCNSFQTDFLQNKTVLILDDGSPAVASVSGRDTRPAPVSSAGKFSIYNTARSDVILPFSSSWVYISGSQPYLTLMGLPGHFLLWSTKDRSALLSLKVRNVPRQCKLTVACSDGSHTEASLGEKKRPLDLSLPFHVKRGLNVLTVAVEPDKSEYIDRQKFINSVDNNKDASENDKQLAFLAAGKLQAVDPRLNSERVPAGKIWLMTRPPNEKGFAPYVDILSLEVKF